MKWIEILRVVGINLLLNKFKVLLTSLGIIVGALTIVLVIAIGQGGEQEVASHFTGLSAETIYVNPDYSAIGVDTDITKIPKLTVENIGQILDESAALDGVYLRASTTKTVTISGEKDYQTVTGVTQGYAEISNLSFETGTDFSEQDFEDCAKIAIIGNGIAQEYFMGSEDALGKSLQINKSRYKIIGVLVRSADGLQGLNADKTVFLPYGTAQENVLDEYSLPQAVGKAKDLTVVKTAITDIQSTLNYYLDDASFYKVEDAGSRIEAATKSARTMKMLLISVAVIVFIVGGIGIMNVLFVTVKERTKEIGILKALGSSRTNIMVQFLLESVAIGLFGGLVGVGLSSVAMPLMRYTQIPVSPSIMGQAVALLFATLTGTIFGFYPAYKASALKPVDALNHE